jgi:GNAT superfamily N-acetyltransferase
LLYQRTLRLQKVYESKQYFDSYCDYPEKKQTRPDIFFQTGSSGYFIVATFQLSFKQYLTHHGGRRAQVEAVRTDLNYRGQGIGTKVFEYIINRAREKGCILLQLTSDKKCTDAIRFYETLGFKATHEGMKFVL